MRDFDDKCITQAVIASMHDCDDPRFRHVMESLVAKFDRQPAGKGPGGESVDTPFYTVEYDFRLRLARSRAVREPV